MMETYRYTRRQRRDGSMDSYDSLASQYPTGYSTLEYWTDGTTTHLMTTAPSETTPLTTSSSPVMSPPRRNTTSIKRLRPPSKDNVVRNSLLAGSVAGIASTVACYPFDVLRTKMQSAAAIESSATTAASSSTRGMHVSVLASRATPSHGGPLQVLTHTLQHGGVRALYTGMTLPLTAQAVYKATVFTANNMSQHALVEWKTQERFKVGNLTPHTLTLSDRFWCGFAGGAVNAALFVTPVEFVRNQLIAQHTRLAASGTSSTERVMFHGPRDVIRHTVATQGWGHLWRGLGMTVARDSLGCGCFFLVHHWTSQQRQWSDDGEQPGQQQPSTSSAKLTAGGAAGLAFWVVALPLDTVKTWVQNGTAASGGQAVTDYIRQEGIVSTAKRLCRGWQVAFGRGVPAAAITMTSYETSYKYFEQL